jgi:hypothetical protein
VKISGFLRFPIMGGDLGENQSKCVLPIMGCDLGAQKSRISGFSGPLIRDFLHAAAQETHQQRNTDTKTQSNKVTK